MKAIFFFVLLSCACAAHDNGQLPHQRFASFEVVAIDAYIPPTRDTGAAWDQDGSLPELQMEIRLNGQTVGRTTVLEASQLHYEPASPGVPALYRGEWWEVLAIRDVRAGDVLEARVTDADDGYPISDCSFPVLAVHLDGDASIGCHREAGMISVGLWGVP